jgi:GNAT superfamily N-acetyltransferase
MSIVIRAMASTDIVAARMLLSQLGYEMNANEVERRYNAVRERGDHAVFVAEDDGRVVAFLHLYERPAFDKPPEAVVQAIVVDQSLRGAGIGKTMMNMAERWASERGFSSIALTSNISRSDAHLFYKRLGYKIEATSHLFRKKLEGPNCGWRVVKEIPSICQ